MRGKNLTGCCFSQRLAFLNPKENMVRKQYRTIMCAGFRQMLQTGERWGGGPVNGAAVMTCSHASKDHSRCTPVVDIDFEA